MRHLAQRWVLIFATALCLLASSDAMAQGWDTFPAVGGVQHFAPSETLRGAASVRGTDACLRNMNSKVGATYYGVIVDVTSATGNATPGDSDAVPYVDGLYQARRDGFDPDTHILMAMGLKNRSIAIHPGQKWASLGFERFTIKQTIDASKFPTFARNGDFGRAMCALAEAVDIKLDALVASAAKRKANVAQRLGVSLGKIPGLRADVDREVVPVSAALAKTLHASLDAAERELENARISLGHDELARAEASLATGVDELSRTPNALKALPELLDSLSSGKKALAERRADLAAQPWPEAQKARVAREIDRCEVEAAEMRATLELGSLVELGSLPAAATLEYCVPNIESAWKSAQDLYFFKWRVLPIMSAFALAFLALLAFGWTAFRRRRAMQRVEADLKDWGRKLGLAGERLIALEGDFPFYFEVGEERYMGESAKLDQACADAVNRVFLLYNEANNLQRRAEKEVENASIWQIEPLERASMLLRETPIEFETGRATSELRIFLPMTESYRGNARTLAEDLDNAYAQAVERLRNLNDAVEHADETLNLVLANSDAAKEAIAERVDLGFPTEHLEKALSEFDERRSNAQNVIGRDPLQCSVLLTDVGEKILTIAERATLGNLAIKALRGPARDKAIAIRERVREVRALGWALSEPGFSPEGRLDKGYQASQRVLALVADGEEYDAHARLTDLKRDLDELAALVEASFHARAGVPPAIENERERVEELRSRIPDAAKILEKLGAENAPETFADESDNLDELAHVLDGASAWLTHIEADHAAERYLSALADLETLVQLIDDGFRLIEAIHTVETALETARVGARASRNALEAHIEEAEQLSQKPGVGSELRTELIDLMNEARATFPALEVDLPNWFDADQSLGRIRSQLRAALTEARAQHEAHNVAETLAASLSAQLAALQRDVERERDDRPYVEDGVKRVIGAFERWRHSLADMDAEGEDLLNVGQGVASAARDMRKVLSDELALAAGARSSLHQAESRLQSVRRKTYGYGVSADLIVPGMRIQKAREALNHRNYNEAITIATDVRRGVDSADSAARSRAARKRREAEARAAAARRRSRSSSSSFSSSSSSRTSSSSFSSSSSSSSSSSFGSSYSGSSSGGSSW